MMSLLGFVCVLQTDTSSSYLAVDSTHTVVGLFDCWSDGLELAAWRAQRYGVWFWQFKRFLKTIVFSLYKCDQRIKGFLKWYALCINPRFTYLYYDCGQCAVVVTRWKMNWMKSATRSLNSSRNRWKRTNDQPRTVVLHQWLYIDAVYSTGFKRVAWQILSVCGLEQLIWTSRNVPV